MADLDEQLRAEFRREGSDPVLSVVLDNVYARQRIATVRRTVVTVLLVAATATAVPFVVVAGGDNGRPPASTATPERPAPTPSESVATLGNPPRRTEAFPGVPSYLEAGAVPRDLPFTVPEGDQRRFYTGPEDAPVAGLVWVRQPVEPYGLPGLQVPLPPGSTGGTSVLVTDDEWEDVAYLRSFSPSGDNDLVIVYGGDKAARVHVITSIVTTAFR